MAIITDLKAEGMAQAMKMFLHDGGVPAYILNQMGPGPALDQFYHLITNHKMGWRDALNWVNNHKEEILRHDRKIRENGTSAT